MIRSFLRKTAWQHTPIMWHMRMKQKQKKKRAASGYYWNGIWKFHYARNYTQTVNGFEAETFDCKCWEDICVPAHIQMEGYDIPQYVKHSVPVGWKGRCVARRSAE